MSIRTTLTLDEGVLDALKSESRLRGIPFRQAVNETLRTGLLDSKTPPARRRLRTEPRHMGVQPGVRYGCIWWVSSPAVPGLRCP